MGPTNSSRNPFDAVTDSYHCPVLSEAKDRLHYTVMEDVRLRNTSRPVDSAMNVSQNEVSEATEEAIRASMVETIEEKIERDHQELIAMQLEIREAELQEQLEKLEQEKLERDAAINVQEDRLRKMEKKNARDLEAYLGTQALMAAELQEEMWLSSKAWRDGAAERAKRRWWDATKYTYKHNAAAFFDFNTYDDKYEVDAMYAAVDAYKVSQRKKIVVRRKVRRRKMVTKTVSEICRDGEVRERVYEEEEEVEEETDVETDPEDAYDAEVRRMKELQIGDFVAMEHRARLGIFDEEDALRGITGGLVWYIPTSELVERQTISQSWHREVIEKFRLFDYNLRELRHKEMHDENIRPEYDHWKNTERRSKEEEEAEAAKARKEQMDLANQQRLDTFRSELQRQQQCRKTILDLTERRNGVKAKLAVGRQMYQEALDEKNPSEARRMKHHLEYMEWDVEDLGNKIKDLLSQLQLADGWWRGGQHPNPPTPDAHTYTYSPLD